MKTNLLFFTKGRPTERVWYYDLSDVKVGKKTPFTLDRFDDFLKLLPARADSERSWSVTLEDLKGRGYDLKAVNPNARKDEDLRTPEELLDLIEEKGREVSAALAELRTVFRGPPPSRGRLTIGFAVTGRSRDCGRLDGAPAVPYNSPYGEHAFLPSPCSDRAPADP